MQASTCCAGIPQLWGRHASLFFGLTWGSVLWAALHFWKRTCEQRSRTGVSRSLCEQCVCVRGVHGGAVRACTIKFHFSWGLQESEFSVHPFCPSDLTSCSLSLMLLLQAHQIQAFELTVSSVWNALSQIVSACLISPGFCSDVPPQRGLPLPPL